MVLVYAIWKCVYVIQYEKGRNYDYLNGRSMSSRIPASLDYFKQGSTLMAVFLQPKLRRLDLRVRDDEATFPGTFKFAAYATYLSSELHLNGTIKTWQCTRQNRCTRVHTFLFKSVSISLLFGMTAETGLFEFGTDFWLVQMPAKWSIGGPVEFAVVVEWVDL